MTIMGSKVKYAKYIVPILQKIIDDNNIENYIEPFVGGANIIDKIKCKNKLGFDKSDTLIALLKTAQTDFDLIPLDGTREMWDKGKSYVKDGVMPQDMSLSDIGAIEFFGSYATRGFPGGMAKNTPEKNYFKQRRATLEKQVPYLKDIIFLVSDYRDIKIPKNSLIYCDPPYSNTKEYGYAKDRFNHAEFWEWVREKSKDNYVIVSEQSAPNDFKPVWTQEVKRSIHIENKFKAVEHLFIYNNGKLDF